MSWFKQGNILTTIFALSLVVILITPAWSQFNFSADEIRALQNLGVSQQEVRDHVMSGNLAPLREKLSQAPISDQSAAMPSAPPSKAELEQMAREVVVQAENELRGKVAEFEAELDRQRKRATDELKAVADGVEGDVEDMIMGYAASTVSLIMLATFAPQVVMVCKTKPSALLYAGTGAIYLTREIANSMKFKAKALSEIEYVEVNLDTTKGLASNAQTARRAFNLQFELLERYIGFLDKAIKSIHEKAKNAKMASIGFFAASGVAAAETFAFDAGACISGEPGAPPASGWLPPRDKFEERIAKSSTLLEAFVLYDQFEREARGESSSMSLSEYEELAKLLSNVPTDYDLRPFLAHAVRALSSFVIAPVHASEEITIRRHEVSSDLRRRGANFAMDVDKVLAILIGGASVTASFFIGPYQAMLQKLASSGTARAIIFGAHGAIALAASMQFEESAKAMDERIKRLRALLEEARSMGNTGFAMIEEALNSEELKKISGQLGLDKNLSEMSLKDIEQSLKDSPLREEIEDSIPDVEIPEDILRRLQGRLMIDRVFSLFVSPVYAQDRQSVRPQLGCYDPASCRPLPVPQFRQSALTPLNSVMQDQRAYGQAVYSPQGPDLLPFEQRLLAHENRVSQYRTQIYQAINQQIQSRGGRPIRFDEQERMERRQFEEAVMRSLRAEVSPQVLASLTQRSERPRVVTQQRAQSGVPRATSLPSTYHSQTAGSISALDYNVLMGLIERLEHTIASSETLSSGEAHWPLHPKHISIFDAIHHRHRQALSPYYFVD
jgi:hypothetical protein